jgi:large repetitive protein
VDAGDSPVKVQLTATHGTLTLSGIVGLDFSAGLGDGVDDATMTFTGSVDSVNAALDGMVFTPTPNYNGPASLKIVTNDQGNTGSGNAKSDTDTLAITVNAVNDAPVNILGATEVTTAINTNLVFNSSNANQITISDVDAGTNQVEVSLSTLHGVITLNGKSGITFESGDGVADSSMIIRGKLSDINRVLNGMYVTPETGYTGDDFLSILTNDLGNSGLGGAMDSGVSQIKMGVGLNINEVTWSDLV